MPCRNKSPKYAAPALIDYVQALVAHTRGSPDYLSGLSPRAALALLAAARAWALLEGREAVLPEDIQTVLPCVAAHRLRPAGDVSHHTAERVGRALVAAVALP